jgi:hypothetical protein
MPSGMNVRNYKKKANHGAAFIDRVTCGHLSIEKGKGEKVISHSERGKKDGDAYFLFPYSLFLMTNDQ